MGLKERKQREKEQKRQKIIASARKLFLERGYKRTSINEIAKAAQLSPGTIYLYFDNKDDLYTALSISMLKQVNKQMKNALDKGSLGNEEQLSSLKTAFLSMFECDPKILLNLFHLQSTETLKKLPLNKIKQMKELSRQFINAMVKIISNAMDGGLLRNENPVAVADIIWGVFSGVILLSETKSALNIEKDDVEKTLETSFDLLFNGLGP